MTQEKLAEEFEIECMLEREMNPDLFDFDFNDEESY